MNKSTKRKLTRGEDRKQVNKMYVMSKNDLRHIVGGLLKTKLADMDLSVR